MKVLHLDTNHPLLLESLTKEGFENFEDYEGSKEEIEKKIHEFDGVVIRSRIKIDKKFLDAAVRLKFIARVGAGMDSIDTEYAEEKGVHLINAPEGNRDAVGEHTLGMLLSLMNKLSNSNREIRQGSWNREGNRGIELGGKTVGIIGYGNMGSAFAKKLRGFHCDVICYDILEGVDDKNAEQVTLRQLQKRSDVLSLHTPWTPLTDKMINAEFIDAFHKPFWFINTARGKSVVTKDLVAALKSGKILGAGLDVLEYEKSSFESLFTPKMPREFKELLEMDNVILSPHVAGWSTESKEKLAKVVVKKILEL